MTFHCDPECGGKCCQAIDCRYLSDGKCSIYETRPLVCRVSDAYDQGLFPNFPTKADYYTANYAMCKSLGDNHASKPI